MRVMKIIIYLCVALLPSIIHCSPCDSDDYEIEEAKVLNDIARNNGIFNDIFKPSKNGFLGVGSCAVTYKGTLCYPNTDDVEVAMKFTNIENKKYAEKEYEIYSYLHAIDNPNVELYGIPSVYYYGTWNTYIMMGITLLDSGFEKSCEVIDLNEIDLLILCKEFVRTSKYIHSCGIFQNDIKCNNFMFRRNNGFIIDYNRAEKMYNTTTLNKSSRKIGMQHAKSDWKRFLRSIADFYGISINFNFNISQPETKDQIQDIMTKLVTTDYPDQIKMVAMEMAKHIFEIVDSSKKNDNTSVYDRIYGDIEKKIDEFGTKPMLVHWLTKAEKKLANEEYKKNPVPSISTIKDPLTLDEINYPEVKWDYFQNKILQLKSGESSTGKTRGTFSTTESSKSGSNGKKKRL